MKPTAEPQFRWAARYLHVDYPGETREEAIAAVREEYGGRLDLCTPTDVVRLEVGP